MRLGRGWGAFAGAFVAVLVVLALAGAAATDVQVDLYNVPATNAGLTSITKGPDGKLWFVEQNVDAVASIDPSSHTIVEHALAPGETPTGIASDGTNLWVAEHGDFPGIVEIDPSSFSTLASFNTGVSPQAIAIGPDGNPWFTENGQIQTIQSGSLVGAYPTGVAETSSYITSGPDNALWFTLENASEVGRIAVSDGTVDLYPTPSASQFPMAIANGPDGRLWYTFEPSGLAALDPSNLASPTITQYSISGGSTIRGLASGPSSHLWVAVGTPSSIREIDTSGNQVGESFVNPDGTDPTAVTVGPDSHIWFTANGSNQIGTLVPVTVPGAPTGVSAAAGDGQATVTFSAPASDGGAAITSYSATAAPGNASASGAASPIVVPGLTNGTSYTFTVTATNAQGTGSASGASNAVIPAGLPKAPTTVTAVRADKSATVTFSGANGNGRPVASYTVTASPGGATATGTASPLTVSGLTNGTAYTFTVTATTSLGTSVASAASNGVTPAGLPVAPTGVTAVRGDKSATVSFAAADPNGSPVSSYTVTASPGGATASGTASPLVVPGLTNGTAYTFSVTATNAVGTSTSSAPSNGVTPAGVPGAPGSVTAARGDQQATVRFAAADPNGSPVTSYTVTASPGGASATGTASPIVVTGLVDGTGYTFSVVATNAVGAGAAGTSNRVVPAGPPGPPRNVSAAAGDGSATVTFGAAAANGSSVDSYTVTASPGGATASGGGSPLTVDGLTNGTAYTFTVTATNALGVGSPSDASNAVAPTGPAVTQTTTTATSTTATTDTTTTQQTTTDAAATTTTAAAATTTTASDSSGGPPVDITIAGDSGIQVGDVNVDVQGDQMQPGSSVTVTVHSTPQQIGQTTVAADGSFAVSASLPDGLAPGAHEIDVSGTRADGSPAIWRKLFTVAAGGVLGVVGSHPKGILATLPVYRVRDHVAATLTTATAAVATVGAVGVALGSSLGGMGLGGFGGGGGGGGFAGGSGTTGVRRRDDSSSGGSGGSLTGVESERLGAGPPDPGEGDDPAIWTRPGSPAVDGWSSTQPGLIARVSPMLARICVDGEYLRAMLGGPWLLLLLPAAVLGVVAAWNTGGAAVPPSLGLFLGILGLSVLDSLLGLVAAVAFGFSVTVSGGIQNASCVRELLAVALVWFALPLGAAAARPLRRHLHLHLDAIWERAADVVIGGLFAAWIVLQMSSALSGVIGFAIPVSEHADAAALAALGFVAARIALETIAVHAFPRRLYTVHYAGEFESGLWQTLASRTFSIALFVFFAVQYMGNTWALYVGTAIVFSPLLLDPIAARLPKSRVVALLQPTGLVKWAYVIFSGYVAAKLLQHFVHDPTQAVRLGFLLLPIPFLLMIVLAYFAGEPGERRAPNPWLARGAGLLLLAACVWVTV